MIFVVNPKVPAKTLAEFAAYARANAGKVNYSSIGAGNVLHLAMEKFKTVGGFEMTHVPYAGRSADAINAVIAGDVDIMGTIVSPGRAAGAGGAAARAGRHLHAALAVGAGRGHRRFPKLTISSWYGLYVHSATPDDVANRLRQAADKALVDPQFRQRFISTRAVVMEARTGARVERYIHDSTKYWAQIISDHKLDLTLD